MKINHSFQINSLLKMIPPLPHFLQNYFAEVKIKNDHMIDKMEDRVKHAISTQSCRSLHSLQSLRLYAKNLGKIRLLKGNLI
jgi:hypothetical protein